MASFSQRLYSARIFLGGCFAAGVLIALWDPAPRFVFTFTIGLTAGILILGPYAAAALYALRIGHLGWKSPVAHLHPRNAFNRISSRLHARLVAAPALDRDVYRFSRHSHRS